VTGSEPRTSLNGKLQSNQWGFRRWARSAKCEFQRPAKAPMSGPLFDHLSGGGRQRVWAGESEAVLRQRLPESHGERPWLRSSARPSYQRLWIGR
jgi:hypothetical protein